MRSFLLTLLLLTATAASAQYGEPDINVRPALIPDTLHPSPSALHPSPFFGYLSYDSVLHAMPQYLLVCQRMKDLRSAYDAEMKRVEDDFNQKYEDFLEGRKDYPQTILLKRQNELQQLLQQNVDFRNRAREELRQAELDALAPLRQQLLHAVATVAKEHKLSFVFNTDRDACLFIDPDTAIDITAEVLQQIDSTPDF